MAKREFNIEIDLLQNQLLNGVIHVLATAPTVPTPVEGQVYYNSTNKTIYVYNGTIWVSLFNVVASETVTGIVRLASTLQAALGTDIDSGQPLVIKPSQLKFYFDALRTAAMSGDLSGSLPSPVVEQSSSTDGFLIKTGVNEARVVSISGGIEIKNAANTADVNLTAASVNVNGNLSISGVIKESTSDTLKLEDSVILLNNNETGSPTASAGIEIERGTAVNTYLKWNETSDQFEIFDGATAYAIARKFKDIITGDGSTTSFPITHGLGTQDVQIQLYDSDYNVVEAEFISTNTTTATINFNMAPEIDVIFNVIVVG